MKRKTLSFKTRLFLCAFLCMGSSVLGEETGSIRIVTPSWEGQTNEDGTGLFFDIIRAVYEPADIKMTYEFVPWKRALMMVNSRKADAMLSVWREDAEKNGQLIPEHPLSLEYTCVVFKKDRIREWEGLETLGSKHVIWLRGYDYHTSEELKPFRFKWSDGIDTHRQAWAMLKRDRIDIYMDAFADVKQYIRINPVDMAPYGLKLLWAEKVYMGFANTERSKRLISVFDERIVALFESGELEEMFGKWDVCPFSADAWKDVPVPMGEK